MPHDPEQNIFRKVFILLVCLDIVDTKGVSCKEEALAFECGHSSGIAQGLTGRQSQPRRSRCGGQIANECRQLGFDLSFRRGQLFPSPELLRPLAQVVNVTELSPNLNRSLPLAGWKVAMVVQVAVCLLMAEVGSKVDSCGYCPFIGESRQE
jgi:hypothetical protein